MSTTMYSVSVAMPGPLELVILAVVVLLPIAIIAGVIWLVVKLSKGPTSRPPDAQR